MPVCTCTPAAQQLPHYMHTSAVKQLHACIHTCTPAAQQLTYYMHTPVVKQLHARTYMYPSCPAASILYAHLSCQTTPCLYIHVLQLPSSSHIMCTLQLSVYIQYTIYMSVFAQASLSYTNIRQYVHRWPTSDNAPGWSSYVAALLEKSCNAGWNIASSGTITSG